MKIKNKIAAALVTGTMLTAGSASAQIDLLEGWSGAASLGAVLTAGNSDTRNLNGSASVSKQIDVWRHTAFGSIFNAENNDIETANRFDLGYKLDRNINDLTYVFGRLRFDSDDFGNIDSRVTGVVGIGRKLIDDGKQTLDAEIGVGAQRTEFLTLTPVISTDPDALDQFGFPLPDPNQEPLDSLETDGATLYGSLNYGNILSDLLTFNSVFTFEADEDNVYSVWDNSLAISVSDRISLSIGLLSRNNTDIVGPLGENTDTSTRLSLVYGI